MQMSYYLIRLTMANPGIYRSAIPVARLIVVLRIIGVIVKDRTRSLF